MAIEIVDLPIEHGGSFQFVMLARWPEAKFSVHLEWFVSVLGKYVKIWENLLGFSWFPARSKHWTWTVKHIWWTAWCSMGCVRQLCGEIWRNGRYVAKKNRSMIHANFYVGAIRRVCKKKPADWEYKIDSKFGPDAIPDSGSFFYCKPTRYFMIFPRCFESSGYCLIEIFRDIPIPSQANLATSCSHGHISEPRWQHRPIAPGQITNCNSVFGSSHGSMVPWCRIGESFSSKSKIF